MTIKLAQHLIETASTQTEHYGSHKIAFYCKLFAMKSGLVLAKRTRKMATECKH